MVSLSASWRYDNQDEQNTIVDPFPAPERASTECLPIQGQRLQWVITCYECCITEVSYSLSKIYEREIDNGDIIGLELYKGETGQAS